MDAQINIRVPRELAEAVRLAATQDRRTLSAYVRLVLTERVEREVKA